MHSADRRIYALHSLYGQ